MRVALVGWDLDDQVLGALAALGLDLVAFTRWHPGQSRREERAGWSKVRCPLRAGGSPELEPRDFAVAVVRHASEMGYLPEFDLVHAVDAPGRLAGAALAERSAERALVASVSVSDVTAGGPQRPLPRAGVWICEHPWVADRWLEHAPDGAEIRTVLGGRSGPVRSNARPIAGRGDDGPLAVFWIPRDGAFDPEEVAAAVRLARESAAGLHVAVLGRGPAAESLRRRVALSGLLAPDALGPADPSVERWDEWLTRASVLGVCAENLTADPAAALAWLRGVPVVRLRDGSGRIERSIREALYSSARRERDLRAASALARKAFEPACVAAGWVRAYLDLLTHRPGGRPADAPDASPSPATCHRSSLVLVATGEREAYASWSVWPDDWATALEWLGPDATRASLAIRLSDVTDIRFQGANALATWDLELNPAESHRTLVLEHPGRSLAASLGLRSSSGVFLTLARAPLCHLPRDQVAPEQPGRRTRVLPRLGGG